MYSSSSNGRITFTLLKEIQNLQSEYGVEDLPTKRVNQDCIENFFENVRSKGGNCTDVTIMEDGSPHFSMGCLSCEKKVRVSYKVKKQDKLCFVKTNWFAHKCNRRVLGSIDNTGPSKCHAVWIRF